MELVVRFGYGSVIPWFTLARSGLFPAAAARFPTACPS